MDLTFLTSRGLGADEAKELLPLINFALSEKARVAAAERAREWACGVG